MGVNMGVNTIVTFSSPSPSRNDVSLTPSQASGLSSGVATFSWILLLTMMMMMMPMLPMLLPIGGDMVMASTATTEAAGTTTTISDKTTREATTRLDTATAVETVMISQQRHTGAVVTAVFHPLDAVDQPVRNRFPAHDADNAAHRMARLQSRNSICGL